MDTISIPLSVYYHGSTLASLVSKLRPGPECFRCLLSTRLREIEESRLSDEEKVALMKKITGRLVKEFDLFAELTNLASELFREVVNGAPGVLDFYKVIKASSMRRALETIPVHERVVNNLSEVEKFRYMVKLSALGNLIDYGVQGHNPKDMILPEDVFSAQFAVDEVEVFYRHVEKGGETVVWLFDNSGEAVYDTILIRYIRQLGNRVVGVVKEEPGFQNDVTISDLLEAGIDLALDDLVAYKGGHSTVHNEIIDDNLRSLLKTSLVVAKGMAHYEYLYDSDLVTRIVFILVPKCSRVASTIAPGSREKIVVKTRGLSV